MSDRTIPLPERIARVIAGEELSANADGGDPHAASAVDERWPDHLNQAIAILNTIREPDQNVDPADAAAWQRIIDAAIANA
jgi:hypothetical protein